MRQKHVTKTPTNGSAVYYCHISSVSHDQYTALPLEGVLVMWHGRISYIYTFWYNFDTVVCQFLETGTSDRCLIGIVQLLRFSGFSLYSIPHFHFSCTVPLTTTYQVKWTVQLLCVCVHDCLKSWIKNASHLHIPQFYGSLRTY